MIYISILWLFIIVLMIILIKLFNLKKNTIMCIILSLLIILFVANINIAIPAALDGCKLWYKAIIPTTFPFVIICNILIYYNGIDLYSKVLGPIICRPLNLSKNCSFPIAASILCGYPLGAKYSADVYKNGYIEKDEYIRLLNIASNVGPLFLIGAVGTALLNNTAYGYIMLLGSYLSCIAIGLITKKKKTLKNMSHLPSNKNLNINFGTAIKNSIENAINTVLSIGGFIIIFSVIIAIIKNSSYFFNLVKSIESLFKIKENTLYSFLLGSVEITNGCNLISNISISVPLKLSLISFLCSFSGLAIIAQVSSFISDTNISWFRYIALKILQGFINFLITYILVLILPTSIYTSKISFIQPLSTLFYILPFILMLVLTLILKIIQSLFFHVS